jgi:hypothetical protein
MPNDDQWTAADKQLISAHRLRRSANLLIAEGYKLLARTSDLDCDPDINSRRLRDGYTKLAQGHQFLAQSDEMVAEAGEMHQRASEQPVGGSPGERSEH